MTQELETLRKRQEQKASEVLTDLMADAVHAESVRLDALQAARITDAGPSEWPREESREVMTILQRAVSKAFGRVRGEYRNYLVDTEVLHPRGAPPVVKARARYKVDRVGGVTHVVKSGETIRSIAKWHYGLACYGNTVWENNAKTLGPACLQVPAGFPVVLPTIEVPNWDAAPRIKAPKGSFAKAVRILYPTLDLSVDGSSARKLAWSTETFAIEATLRFRGNVLIQKKGTLGPDFAAKRYQAEAARVLDDIMAGGFQMRAEDKRGVLTIRLTNRKARRVAFAGQLKLATGGPKLRLAGASEDAVHKDHALRFLMSVEAVFRIVPRKAGKPVQVFDTPLSVSTSLSSDGVVPRPLIAARGSVAQAAAKGSAAVLVKMGVV